jgi:hypothetical protein
MSDDTALPVSHREESRRCGTMKQSQSEIATLARRSASARRHALWARNDNFLLFSWSKNPPLAKGDLGGFSQVSNRS